jgi:hypothetical protein
MSVKVTGARQVSTAFSRLDYDLQRRLQEAIRETTEAVAAGARRRVPVLTGELRDTIRTEYTPQGNVGLVKAGFGKLRRRSRATGKTRRRRAPAAQGAGVYAMVIEYGSPHRGVAARPFLRPALWAERNRHQGRITGAINAAANAVAQQGAA